MAPWPWKKSGTSRMLWRQIEDDPQDTLLKFSVSEGFAQRDTNRPKLTISITSSDSEMNYVSEESEIYLLLNTALELKQKSQRVSSARADLRQLRAMKMLHPTQTIS